MIINNLYTIGNSLVILVTLTESIQDLNFRFGITIRLQLWPLFRSIVIVNPLVGKLVYHASYLIFLIHLRKFLHWSSNFFTNDPTAKLSLSTSWWLRTTPMASSREWPLDSYNKGCPIWQSFSGALSRAAHCNCDLPLQILLQ